MSAWDVDQVCSWIRGLEDECAQFTEVFREVGVNGKRLLGLDYDSLAAMNIIKFGWQECLLHSIQQLESLNVERERETLAVITLRLDCEARNLGNLLRNMPSKSSHDITTSRTLSLEILLGISYITETIKYMCPWLDRVPYDNCEAFGELKKKFLDLAFQLIIISSKTENTDEVQQICSSIISLCDEIIFNSKDPLAIQVSSLELVTLRRESGETLGISIASTGDNVHVIGQIKPDSVADRSQKIHAGDEIVQLNYETVIGWKLVHLLSIFNDHKKDVTLMLKKKPRHMTPSGYQKKKLPKKQLPSSAFQTEYTRNTANAKANSRKRIKQLRTSADDSISEHDIDENVSDSEVFNSKTEFVPPSGGEEKTRRATVTGASPTVQRRVVGSTENISSLRPKSYFPVSTNIPILPNEMEARNSELKKFGGGREQNENKVAPLPGSSPPAGIRSAVESPSRKRSSESSAEVAGGTDAESAPRLLHLTKLDSTKRAEMMMQKKRNESVSSIDSVLSSSSYSSQGSSYSSQGSSSGVLKQQHKVHFRSERDLMSPLHSGLLRRNILRRTGLNRRISCKDLGGGDCQGWLWKKKGGTGLVPGRWSKCWFVLKNKNLYYYNSTEDQKAQGVIHLPGFTISPTHESRSKKYAFKAYNDSGVVFYFASDRQDDMAKWMNKIGLSSLVNLDTSHLTTTAGFQKPGREEPHLPDFSESEEEGTTSLKDSGSTLNVGGSREDLIGLYRNIRAADLDLSGTDVKARRSTILRASTINRGNPRKTEAICHLLSLKRTLKDKEQIVLILNELLDKSPVTPIDLIHFKVLHPSIFRDMENGEKFSETSLGRRADSEDGDASLAAHSDLGASDSSA